MREHDRAVSEVIGFVLIFGIVLGTISLVYVSGIAGLDDTRDSERLQNAERAFDVLADNFQKMGNGEAPNRATEIKLADAQLDTTDHQSLRFDSDSLAQSATSGPVSIRYSAGTDTQIYYEAGAVIRVDDGNSIMLSEPDFIFQEDRIVVRYLETRGAGQSVGGSTTVLVRGEVRDSSLLASATDIDSDETATFEITTESDRTDAWERYLESEIDWEEDACSVGGDGETVTCSFEVAEGGSIHVARTRIRVTLA